MLEKKGEQLHHQVGEHGVAILKSEEELRTLHWPLRFCGFWCGVQGCLELLPASTGFFLTKIGSGALHTMRLLTLGLIFVNFLARLGGPD